MTSTETLPLLLDTQPLVLSVVSLWEVAIRSSLGRADFQVEAAALRLGLLGQGFRELPVRAEHVLVVQAQVEGLQLLSADRALTGYGAHVRVVD